MENISRRILLKSITAATLTVAASVVLTGCCTPSIPSGFCPETQTLSVPEGTMTVSTTKFYKNTEGNLVLGLSVKNDVGMSIPTGTRYLWKVDYTFDHDKAFSDAYRQYAYYSGNSPSWSVTSFPAGQQTETELTLADPSSLVNLVSDPLSRSRFENWSSFSLTVILESQGTGLPSISEEIRFNFSRP